MRQIEKSTFGRNTKYLPHGPCSIRYRASACHVLMWNDREKKPTKRRLENPRVLKKRIKMISATTKRGCRIAPMSSSPVIAFLSRLKGIVPKVWRYKPFLYLFSIGCMTIASLSNNVFVFKLCLISMASVT